MSFPSPSSTFTAERFVASRLARGRCAVAGDAAHVVSPIGGQGMSLGWMDALALADCVRRCLRESADYRVVLADYDRSRRAAARAAIRRAELFMAIGQGFAWPGVRDACVKTLLSPWVAPRAARLFAMGSAPLA